MQSSIGDFALLVMMRLGNTMFVTFVVCVWKILCNPFLSHSAWQWCSPNLVEGMYKSTHGLHGAHCVIYRKKLLYGGGGGKRDDGYKILEFDQTKFQGENFPGLSRSSLQWPSFRGNSCLLVASIPARMSTAVGCASGTRKGNTSLLFTEISPWHVATAQPLATTDGW